MTKKVTEILRFLGFFKNILISTGLYRAYIKVIFVFLIMQQ